MGLAVKAGIGFVIIGFLLQFIFEPTTEAMALSFGFILGGLAGTLWILHDRRSPPTDE